MLESVEAMGSAAAPVMPVKLTLSDDARASLEAVRVAQEAARARARQQMMRARLLFVLFVGGAGCGIMYLRPRITEWRRTRAAHAAALMTTPAVDKAPAAAPSAGTAVAPSATEAALGDPRDVVAAPTASAARTSASGGTAAAGQDQAEKCDLAANRETPWRLSPEACAVAFQANPTDATLALAVAHAQHARGRLDEAATWAKRALTLDEHAAEAYVLIARADRHDGRIEGARAAYRRYLDLAPHGWHEREARAAVRSGRTSVAKD